MNFTEINLLNANGQEVVSMSYQNPSQQKSYILKAFVGLDVDGIMARFYGNSATGQRFYSMNLGKRDVVLRIVINPNYSTNETVDSLRARIYESISSGRMGAMTVQFSLNDVTQAVIKGFVTKVEVAHFASVPEIQLTLDCSRDPMLRSEQEYLVNTAGFGTPLSPVITDNASTAPHGLKMQLTCATNVTTFKISDNSPDAWEFEVTPGTIDGNTGFKVGDVLHISSEDKDRHIYIVRNGDPIHLAHKIKAGSVWPIIFPGENTFTVTSGFTWNEISYRAAYWGV